MFKQFVKQCAVAGLMVGSPLLAQASQLPDYPFVHASGTAFVHVVPTRGEVDFDVSADDAEPEAARAVIDGRIGELRALVEQQGLSANDIEVKGVRREMQNGGEAKAEVYKLLCSVHIDVKDLSKWRALLQPLLAMKNLDHFSVTFGTDERDKIEMELATQALKDAQRRADTMARAVGKRAGAATAISSDQLKNLTSSVGLQTVNDYTNTNKQKGKQPEGGDLLMVSSLRLSQSLDVIFRIK
ncbi:SIMPL domain-containing protein [Rugamonas sp. CCM 8940]|uniref:SIMPL domain-containing protein n=1 Tax=Rugamonas sp. CCM 8940 TaxID=2765359 RepID=UPI0018F33578|nr:SIMPL domain-containing protein [Rugamonas sp. CCM 8940]MBJ7312273.1 SIMPL domain-containing protein [Rugamonas sp. CCM 8940]